MSSHTTDTLGLHTWEPLDMFTREEFNKNFDLIDAHAGEALARLAAAQGTADGAAAAAKAAQATANSAQSAANAAQTTANGRLRINYGYYVGSGWHAETAGENGPTHTLNAGFEPKLVLLAGLGDYCSDVSRSYQVIKTERPYPPFFIMARNMQQVEFFDGTAVVYFNLTWGSTSLKIYSSPLLSTVKLNSLQALDAKNCYYHWIAIG